MSAKPIVEHIASHGTARRSSVANAGISAQVMYQGNRIWTTSTASTAASGTHASSQSRGRSSD